MAKQTKIDLYRFFDTDAHNIRQSRSDASVVHNSNIRTAGNETEIAVRKVLQSRLTNKYKVSQGHVINSSHQPSPQLDVMITDHNTIPLVVETLDHTEYFSCESVYAIGEIKSTYKQRAKPIEKFCHTIGLVKNQMGRVSVTNTCIDGKLHNETDINHWLFQSPNQTINPLFSFMFFADGGDFKEKQFDSIVSKHEKASLPNIIVFLDYGVLFQAIEDNGALNFYFYPEYDNKDAKWYLYRIDKNQDNPGTLLTMLYYYLIRHLKYCRLNPPDYYSYLKEAFVFRRPMITRLG